MTNHDLGSYTDLMWLQHMLRTGDFGPVNPLIFKPARDRLFYIDQTSPKFVIAPLSTCIGYEQEEKYGASTVKVDFDGYSLRYSFHSNKRVEMAQLIKAKIQPRGYWRIFCSHLQLSIYMARFDFPEGGLFLDFGDKPNTDMPVLAYSTHKANDLCIVDPFFIVSNAYFNLKRKLKEQTMDMAAKKNTVFWRGSASGAQNRFSDSQRYLLCSKTTSSKFLDRLDFGIVNTPQAFLKQLEDEYGEVPKFARAVPKVCSDTFSQYRYGIDVDGNSNSWGGFFTKMLSQAYLVKIKSRGGYRQWFYPRLMEREYYATVASDLADFDDVLENVFALSISQISDKAFGLYDFASSMSVFEEIDFNNVELNKWLSKRAECAMSIEV